VGSLPFIFSEQPNLSITDAFFESFSGLTTTGATTLVGLDSLPHAILFYRQMLQWFGGMGIIVLAVAILPILGVGGMQLYRAEMPGPLKDNKMRPRIAETAKTLWLIYVLLTIACALALWFAGMPALMPSDTALRLSPSAGSPRTMPAWATSTAQRSTPSLPSSC
jgi:trk system potassium uptake protein TrkH